MFGIIFNKLFPILIIGLLVFIYKSFFLNTITSAGDFPYYWDTYINELSIPYSWNPHWPTGLGGNQAIVLPLKLYFHLPIVIFVHFFHVPWEVIERIVFFFAFLALAIYSSFLLTKSWIGSLIYVANTWVLMVVSGGQIGIALSYAIAPLVLWCFIRLIDTLRTKVSYLSYLFSALIAAIVFSIQIMFDVRIAYIVLIAVILYFLLFWIPLLKKFKIRQVLSPLVYAVLIPTCVTLLLNAYWLLPLVFSSTSLSAVNIQPTLEQVKFFSFATFSNTIGFLHPNWPENIFGKVGFMKAEFLLLPILAFASLLFVDKNQKNEKSVKLLRRLVIFFGLISLLGVFLAKGANEPFGNVYLWMFEHVPGFTLFRDSTKFYVLIALGYSFLIPFTLHHISTLRLFRKVNKYNILSIGFIIYCIILLKPAFFGEVTGIFKENPIPQEYIQLKNYLESEKKFSRTLWMPKQQRFGYYSNNHPSLSGMDFFLQKKSESMVNKLMRPDSLGQLQAMSVKYVILPYDSESEIFLRDRKYDEKSYIKTLNELRSIKWLAEDKHFGKIVLFAVPNPRDHISVENVKAFRKAQLSYSRINDTKYQVTIKGNAKGEKLIFSEQYDPGWKLKYDKKEITTSQYKKYLNSFSLPENITVASIEYEPQHMLYKGYIISFLTLLAASVVILFIRRRNK